MTRVIEVPTGIIDPAAKRCAHIPVLREGFAGQPSLDPAVFARTTCYPAGHLVSKNAGWRNIRPVLAPSACTGCLQCYLYCPDGAISFAVANATAKSLDAAASPSTRSCRARAGSPTEVGNASASPAISGTGETLADFICTSGNSKITIDYDFCKGCGICVKMCKFGALEMVSESEALAVEDAQAAPAAEDAQATPAVEDAQATPAAAATAGEPAAPSSAISNESEVSA